MMETISDIQGVMVYVAGFLPEEAEAGQNKAQSMAVRRLVREVLGREAVLTHRPDGSPAIEGSDVEVSVSHTSGLAVLAVGGRMRIGVDVELPRATLRRVARKFLSASEMDVWVSDSDLLRAWTIKEALYKAAGCSGVDFANDVVLPGKEDGFPVGKVVDRDRKETCYEVHSTPYGGACITVACPLNQD